jgi:hypothetical protein
VKTSLESIDSAASMAGGFSTFSSRWASGMFSGIWSAAPSRPSGGFVVACRILGMLVALAGVLTACFLPWRHIQISLPNGADVAGQSPVGWQIWHGRLTAIVFALVAMHILAHLHRLRYLAPTYAGFFVAGFAAVGLSFWQFSAGPGIAAAPIRWSTFDPWQQPADEYANASTEVPGADGKTTGSGPRSRLESLIPSEALPNGTPAHTLTNQQLLAILAERGEVRISSHEGEGPIAGIMLGIAVAFVGLLEFIFTFATDPVRRLLGPGRSSLATGPSGRGVEVEPRISKMAVTAALLGLLPIIPLVFLGMMAIDAFQGYSAQSDQVAAAIGFLVGLSIFPTTLALFAMYRIRRSRGMLHGLPLAFAASITWPLVIADVVVFAASAAITDARDEGTLLSVLMIALIGNVVAFVFGWNAVKKPL